MHFEGHYFYQHKSQHLTLTPWCKHFRVLYRYTTPARGEGTTLLLLHKTEEEKLTGLHSVPVCAVPRIQAGSLDACCTV